MRLLRGFAPRNDNGKALLGWAAAQGATKAHAIMLAAREVATRRVQNIPDPLAAVENGVGGGNLRVLRALRNRGLKDSLPVYLVGGPVRDVLLGAPIRDLDFALEGDAPALAQEVAVELGAATVSHPRFKTATVILDDSRIDLVTARKETYPHPGALPEVTLGNIQDDLARRDFTINALALPLFQARPEILDWHGGLPDLGGGIVRTLHRQSFIDDPTRIFRAVRYQQRFGFTIEEETQSQLGIALAGGYLDAVSGDRLRHELERILGEDQPAPVLEQAIELGVLAAVHPSLNAAEGLKRFGFRASRSDQAATQETPLEFLAALVYPLSESESEAVILRFNMPHRWAQTVRDSVLLRQFEGQLSQPELTPSQTYELLDGLCQEALGAASKVAESGVVSQRLTDYLDELRYTKPTLGGDDLLAMGVASGPLVGQILRQLRAARLDQAVRSVEEERRWVREMLAKGAGNETG